MLAGLHRGHGLEGLRRDRSASCDIRLLQAAQFRASRACAAAGHGQSDLCDPDHLSPLTSVVLALQHVRTVTWGLLLVTLVPRPTTGRLSAIGSQRA